MTKFDGNPLPEILTPRIFFLVMCLPADVVVNAMIGLHCKSVNHLLTLSLNRS